MRVIIFGASGFIGGRIRDYLTQAADFEVFGFSSKECNLLIAEEIEEIIKRYGRGAYIIVCSTINRYVENSPESMWKNIEMIKNLTDSLRNNRPAALIFTSTTDVYGFPPKTTPITEETPPCPSDYYALSKLISEQLLLFHPECPFPVSILRLPGVFGQGDRFRSIIGKFAKKILKGEEITLSKMGKTKRDFVDVHDLCCVIYHILRSPYKGILNIATGKSISMRELIDILSKEMKIEPSVRYLETVNLRDVDLTFDISRLRSLYPDVSFRDLRYSIAQYIRVIPR